MIYVEDLQVSAMSKSAKGTEEEHGKNVKQKSGLNWAILDQSWFEFRRQLDYKTQWLGSFIVAVPPQNTSRTCPYCGYTAKENRQTQADFECVECGYTENADVVGALNILERGRAIVQA
ncbi:transposase [Haemophilus influenzae]|nr:transposase [Haemophilus influenzae]MCK8867128.1 transposase [Haemophilus influenzae]MCK8982021.1 transposase [Haemophilus influenzae]MCK9665123.1 transposase [Haemophilus influenzae]